MTEQELREIKLAWARGEVVQYRVLGGHWTDWGYDNELYIGQHEWRIKPKTIRIGNYDVPEPVRTMGNVKILYLVDICRKDMVMPIPAISVNGVFLKLGLYHATREDAELHAKALLSFTEQKK